VFKCLVFTFGFKWLLIAIALLLATRLQRRMFIASLLLILLAFLFQFSVEIVANHKFLNLWVIFANFFVAYALWRIWRAGAAGKAVAIMLAITVSLRGPIEWFRIHNDTMVDVPFNRSRLATWLLNNPTPADTFLTLNLLLHT